MKLIKYIVIFVLVIGLGLSAWIYYPKYQIHKIKKQSVEVSTNIHKISYLDYFRSMKKDEINHLAIGDSVIRGVGAGQNEDLVNQFSNKLGSQIQKNIQFQNEGINGITSGELRELVLEGRFDEEMKKADIITINVGGNDVLRAAKGQNLQNVFQSFGELQTSFTKNLTDIASRIKSVNPGATIVFLELYNPLSPSDKLYPLADQLLPKWNLKLYETANQYSPSLVIETTKVINGERPENLSPDGVHPNSNGYSAISELMIYQFKHQYRIDSV
ncbi:GDSL-type esterase/lipase family protein [Neobacillus citreus]|uniref:GDSL-type esterase/lipase family protein n=1 Tax=Neobacillus citreus TaxID=2833578 RepID=A0A942SUQ5_9BACI|nr:GDSL-type esterase/lipase family protein [Neobacillus citreus]MCH6266843.1 GDSL-type esterase/lipase family protein [Neobacillus citreus]